MVRRLTFFIVALLLIQGHSLAESIQGKVVGVTDGDTITVLDQSKTQHKIRLSGIDAPERGMPFGQKSKQHLSDLVAGKQVTVEATKIDRYKRSVGKVLVDGHDANLAQVEAGFAWHYKDYQREQSKADRLAYSQAEDLAREASKGLWMDGDPVPPWNWRKNTKN
ncbi:MAG: thermonuclease family protein [Burkholderiaceae bacterium]|nr:thermonuclease family protein [Burkholderiaceae bacterium]